MSSKLDPLIEALESDHNDEVVKALGDDPQLVRERSEEGDTLLHYACYAKRAGVVERLLAMRAEVHARGRLGRSPLHCAVHSGGAASVRIVRSLIDAGANASLRDDVGWTPAQWAQSEIHDRNALASVQAVLDPSGAAAKWIELGLGSAKDEGDGAPGSFEATQAQMRRVERRSQTGAALVRLTGSYRTGAVCDTDKALKGCPRADMECVRDAERVLATLQSSTWGEPLRRWLSEPGVMPALVEWVGRYYGAHPERS